MRMFSKDLNFRRHQDLFRLFLKGIEFLTKNNKKYGKDIKVTPAYKVTSNI